MIVLFPSFSEVTAPSRLRESMKALVVSLFQCHALVNSTRLAPMPSSVPDSSAPCCRSIMSWNASTRESFLDEFLRPWRRNFHSARLVGIVIEYPRCCFADFSLPFLIINVVYYILYSAYVSASFSTKINVEWSAEFRCGFQRPKLRGIFLISTPEKFYLVY